MTGIDLDPIHALSIPERLQIVQAILDGIAFEYEPPMTDEFKAELQRRLDDSRAHPERCIPWEVVKADLLKRRKDSQ